MAKAARKRLLPPPSTSTPLLDSTVPKDSDRIPTRATPRSHHPHPRTKILINPN